MRLLSAATLGLHRPLKAEDWADHYDLSLVINAGRFGEDWRSYLGYLRVAEGQVHQPRVRRDCKSLFVFDPLLPSLPKAGVLDLDAVDFSEVREQYGAIVQNLRIVRNLGVLVWPPSLRRWSEAASGVDGSGRVLFIFCRSPYTVNELGRCLLALPLDLVALQHLEGGGEATLPIRTPKLRTTLVGSYESGANVGVGRPYMDLRESFRLPNVIGVEACRRGAER